MKFKICSFFLSLFLIFSLTPTGMAAEPTSFSEELEDVYSYIFSEEVNQMINASIDFNKYGTQEIYIGNGITYVYENKQSITRSVVSDTMTSVFKLGERDVATLRLACTFSYNGSSVTISESDYRATAETVPNYTCTAVATHSRDSSGDMYVSATYELYLNNNYRANGYMDMSCDKNGNITKHYPWS